MTQAVAIVGMACRYPDARSPAELWENVLAGRRAFRRIPPERLCAEDYFAADPNAPDRTYNFQAALIENYEFDRARFNISGGTYRATDLAHWLALDIADQALTDAGLAHDLPRESTAVYVGNTLTGEFSRANTLRLRWPYTRRVLAAALEAEGWEQPKLTAFLESLERSYKYPFPPIGEDTLAGGLSNTIAGRITNFFDLKGGGYTVDGACASSLLAVSTACSALAAGDIQVALAGGVDLSLDPFELVGFAKTRALASGEMRVYDARSDGFSPGEGCGFVVLMRHADALAQQRRIYAAIRGWGVSSDGSGGISRPEPAGQLLAVRRAYCRAGFPPSTVAYFEGHGTGTSVGDATELQVLSQARREADPAAPPAAIGSVKANIGHTKAAAGVAGLIKAAMSVSTQVLPPTTGCETPHAQLTGDSPALRVLRQAEPWPAGEPLRAAVSAMGFGGINAHVVLEGAASARQREAPLRFPARNEELFLFTSRAQIAKLIPIAARLSRAELTDVAANLAAESQPASTFRAAVIASTPEELAARLANIEPSCIDPLSPPRIGFLFPGQDGHHDQPAIVKASLAALSELRRLSLNASVAIGHSLGELTALCWAGALSESDAIDLAAARGRIMSALPGPRGAMATIAASPPELAALIAGESAVIAAFNTPSRTVISGEAGAVQRVMARARSKGIAAVVLPVSRAFHSPLLQPAADPLAQCLADVNFRPLDRAVISTVTGAALDPHADLRGLLRSQLTSPVRFAEAVAAVRDEVELWIEVGHGRVLSTLASDLVKAPVFSAETLLTAFAAAFTMGAPVDCGALFAGRFVRPFAGLPRFFSNPCEMAPAREPVEPVPSRDAEEDLPLGLVRRLVAERTELPLSAIQPGQRLLSDLHLNSITVAQLVAEAARQRGLAPLVAPLRFANATVAEIAQVLESAPAPVPEERVPPGVDSWVRAFHVELTPRALPAQTPRASGPGEWRCFISPDHPFAGVLPQLVPQLPAAGGALLCLPPHPDESSIPLLLEAAHAAHESLFVMLQQGGGAASLARTLHLEAGLTTCVVDLPFAHPQAPQWIAAEAHAAKGYSEAHYDADGRRYEPALRLLPPAADRAVPNLTASDVLLVTGGGKGIAAECALALARDTGVKLAVLGRSDPSADPELAANLERMRATYVAADVTDAAAVETAFRQIETGMGPVTAILHGAGINTPRLLATLDEASFRATLAPKLKGLRNLLNAADPQRLRLLIAFGSIIARIGLPGEGDYAVANEWLAREVERWRTDHPHCRCTTVEWSVWSGIGMGQRLGRIDDLMRKGITPITPEEGVRVLKDLLAREAPAAVVVTGRFGDPPTLRLDHPELPFARFLEQPLVHYPGVELISNAELSTRSDPYLNDHVFQGTPLLPAVVGLEAMAQVAAALAGASQPPVFENVQFSRPVHVPEGRTVTVRLAALMRATGLVEVVLRSSETAYQVDHFRALCSFTAPPVPELVNGRFFHGFSASVAIPLDPARDLYGSLLFQSGRFRRLRAYHRLRATECIAEIIPDPGRDWFARYLPATLLLGDPGARDALIHSIQACIPHATVLPIGVESIMFSAVDEHGPRYAHARERSSHDTGLLVYDLEVTNAAGAVLERWQGLRLQIVAAAPRHQPWIAPLLAPYLERKIREFAPGADLSVAIGQNGSSQHAIEQALGFRAALTRRPDGKPEVNGHPISASHAGDLVVAVAGGGVGGCDLEFVSARPPEVWRAMLGADHFALAELISREGGEDMSNSATRVWCAMECLKKAGAMRGRPLVFQSARPDGWIELAAGASHIPTYRADNLAFAVIIEA